MAFAIGCVVLGSAEAGVAECAGNGREELGRGIVAVDNVVAAHDVGQTGNVERIVIAAPEAEDAYARVLTPQALHERCLLAIEHADIYFMTKRPEPRHQIDHQRLCPAGPQGCYDLQNPHDSVRTSLR